MATASTRQIRETPQQLANFEQVYAGKPQQARVRLIRVLRTQPELTLEEASETAGVPMRTGYRWWKTYQSRGLLGLLNMTLGRPVGSTGMRVIHRKEPNVPAAVSTAELIRLMNGLPMDLGLIEGINGLREHLKMLLTDVDRISISVNSYCDLEDPENYRPTLIISQRPDAARRIDEGMEVRTTRAQEEPSQDILEQMRAGGFPFDRYRDPVIFDLWFGGTADLGTILLWRELENEPISQQTIELLESLRPFLTYVFSGLITRHYYANPRDRVFYSVLGEMARSARLTPQEQRIISYRLLGYSYKRIASELGRTEGAVKKQLASVHRKTGTQGHGELFAKYFTPRLLLEQ